MLILWSKSLYLQPMKIFAFIMACVILIISVVPCTDAKAFGSKRKTSIVKAAQQNNKPAYPDACSPLCICSCCAGCSMYSSSPQLVKFVYQISPVYPSFILADTHQVALPIWQPPQL